MNETIELEELIEKQIKMFEWVSLPITEKRSYDVLQRYSGSVKNKRFSTEGIDNVFLRYTGKSNGILKFVGEALWNFSGIKGRMDEPYELHEACFKLFSSLDYGIISCNITESVYEELPEDLKVQSNSYWIVDETDVCNLKLRCIGANGKSNSYLYYPYGYTCDYMGTIRPIYLLSESNKKVRIVSNEINNGKSRSSPYKVILMD